ncbi:MAG: Rap1a/Tai family immunity protein [Methylosarcina sp.]
MQLKHLTPLLLCASFITGTAKAANVTEEDFVAQKTRNLINLCTASPQEPHYREAIHFCHGYLVGAFHYYQAQTADKAEFKLFCSPEPKPSRNEAIAQFVSWAQQHPEYMNEMPVETEFRFLAEKFPCDK